VAISKNIDCGIKIPMKKKDSKVFFSEWEEDGTIHLYETVGNQKKQFIGKTEKEH